MPNHLAGESSPYLLQHADNPVDWYPWSPEALERAAREDKPIFLSIGYSACHWCHVMERESFTDAVTAELLNRHFISIKVDREERPDLDAVYMDAVAALTGGGGWPLSVWLTPQGAPFFGGTYFPDSPRYGTPSFRQILSALVETWQHHREDLENSARRLVEHLRAVNEQDGHPPHSVTDAGGSGKLNPPPACGLDTNAATIQREALAHISASFDRVHGGWGSAPKFPQPVLIEYLLTRHAIEPDSEIWTQIERTLDAMAAGGIYDQLGGGFHRYSTDEQWLVPHFEKMLYDNALLARCYLHAWQLSGRRAYKRVAEETLDYLLRDMRHPEGGFFSSEDADSEGEEGRFFVWTKDEIEEALPPVEATVLCKAYGVTAAGNFEGRNILRQVHLPTDTAEQAVLSTGRARLNEIRNRRIRPGRDEKILASWNGLALAAFAEAGRIMGSQRYETAALECATFLSEQLIHPDHRVSHSWKDGQASTHGFLEDQALLADGMLALYQATFDEHWFVLAQDLLDAIPAHFLREGGGFYDTGLDHETLITRPRSLADSPLPSGNAAAAAGFLRLAAYTGESSYETLWEEAVATVENRLSRAPSAFAHWLTVHFLGARGLQELAVVGASQADDTLALLGVVSTTYYPDLVVAARPPGSITKIPLLAGREPAETGVGGNQPATARLCRRSTCLAPIDDPDVLQETLKGAG
jgi:uncharacterized protein YyaL (SSP411 family)